MNSDGAFKAMSSNISYLYNFSLNNNKISFILFFLLSIFIILITKFSKISKSKYC